MQLIAPAIVQRVRTVDEALLAPGSVRQFTLLRAGLALAMAVRLCFVPVTKLVEQPAELFRAPALLAWLQSPPPAAALFAVQALGVAAAICVFRNLRPNSAFRVLWGCYLVLAGLESSFGKVLHNEVLLLLVALPIAAASVDGAARGSRASSTDAGWPRRLALVVVASAYAVSGYQKLRWSGIDWALGDNMRWILYQAAAGPDPLWPWLTKAMGDQLLLTQLFASGALAAECLFPLVLWRRWMRPWFAAVAVLMHASIWLFLGLDYSAWIAAVLLVLVLPDLTDRSVHGGFRISEPTMRRTTQGPSERQA